MNKLAGNLYRDKEGNKITSEQLEGFLRDDDYRVVVQDRVGPYFISTVWMGVPYGVREPFDYFETMVFLTPPNVEDPRDNLGKALECYRYNSHEEAVMGHYQVISEWKEKDPLQEDLDEVSKIKPKKTMEEVINENIEITEKWIKEGKFNSHAEMVFARNMCATIDQYRKSKEDSKSSDEFLPDPNAR